MSFNFQTTKSQGVALAVNNPKAKLAEKYKVNGFQLCDLVWLRPSEGRHKYEVLVRYIDPQAEKTKRSDGSYQKIVRFGTKGINDFIDPPHSDIFKTRQLNRIRQNTDNPLHANFFSRFILNGESTDPFENFKNLRKNIFKR